MRSSWLSVLALGLVASALGGCASPHEFTIRVKDPRLVRIEDTPTPASLADGAPTIASGVHSDDPWSLVVFREDDGALRLRCRMCNRDAFLVGADGVMHFKDEREAADAGLARPSPEYVAHGALVALPYSYCGFPGRRGCRGGEWSGRRLTPWSNVVEVRERRGPRETGSPLILAGGIFFAALGTVFLVSGLRSDHPGEQVGGAIAGGGLYSLSALFIKFFVDGHSERVIDPPPAH